MLCPNVGVPRLGSNHCCHGYVTRLGYKECHSKIAFEEPIVSLLCVAASESCRRHYFQHLLQLLVSCLFHLVYCLQLFLWVSLSFALVSYSILYFSYNYLVSFSLDGSLLIELPIDGCFYVRSNVYTDTSHLETPVELSK